MRNRNMLREANAARAIMEPITAPVIVAALLLDEVLWLDVGETPADVDVVVDVVMDAGVDEATDAVDDGELELRHVSLFESATISKSELPPCLP